MKEIVKHTPGPWSWSERKADPNREYPCKIICHVQVGDGNLAGNTLALVSLGGSGAISVKEDDVRANARLIAAVPDLLEACISLSVTFGFDKGCDCGTGTCPCCNTLAAIAKATGKEPS